jgi:hypothetical protein
MTRSRWDRSHYSFPPPYAPDGVPPPAVPRYRPPLTYGNPDAAGIPDKLRGTRASVLIVDDPHAPAKPHIRLHHVLAGPYPCTSRWWATIHPHRGAVPTHETGPQLTPGAVYAYVRHLAPFDPQRVVS